MITLLAGKSSRRGGAVRARSTLVRVGRRRCRVPAGTPMAALAALLRRFHEDYRIRDYGSCSRRTAAASGQLFVKRIAGDANRGNDGWFYKVNDRAPEVGAADPSARLRKDDRLLWFYCVFDEAARTCQRSLRIVPRPNPTTAEIRVTVRGYDNAGHWVPVPGATVSGPGTAVTGVDGVAQLTSAAPGRFALEATKKGMIDAFRVFVSVK